VPLQVPTPPKIGEAEFKKLMSYRSNNNVPEDDSSYLKRMSGVVRLYAALVQSPGVVWGKANPLGIANGWKWLALVLNTDPLPGVTATVLFDFLEVAGHALWKEYRNQFEKLLCVLIKQYLPKIEAVTSAGQGGPTTRLRQFLDVCIQTLHKYSLNLIFHFVLLFRNVLPLALSQNQKEFYLLDCGGANTGSTFWIVERLILVLPSGLWRG
jgi:nucleoporin GLE1